MTQRVLTDDGELKDLNILTNMWENLPDIDLYGAGLPCTPWSRRCSFSPYGSSCQVCHAMPCHAMPCHDVTFMWYHTEAQVLEPMFPSSLQRLLLHMNFPKCHLNFWHRKRAWVRVPQFFWFLDVAAAKMENQVRGFCLQGGQTCLSHWGYKA